jgi:hypothetical protein
MRAPRSHYSLPDDNAHPDGRVARDQDQRAVLFSCPFQAQRHGEDVRDSITDVEKELDRAALELAKYQQSSDETGRGVCNINTRLQTQETRTNNHRK